MRIRFSVIGAAFLVFLGCQAGHSYPTPRPVAFHPIELLQPTASATPDVSATQTPTPPTQLEWPVPAEAALPEDAWEMHITNRTYLIPVTASFDPSEFLNISYVMNGDGRPLAVFTTMTRRMADRTVMVVWRILDAEKKDGRVVVYALEGVDLEFANCPHYEVSSYNRNTPLLFEGDFAGVRVSAAAEESLRFYRCAPTEAIRPPDGYRLADASFVPDGTIWALFDRTEYQEAHMLLLGRFRADGTPIWIAKEPVPFVIWNFVTTDGLVCGIRTDVSSIPTPVLGEWKELPCWNLGNRNSPPLRYARMRAFLRAADLVELFP